MQGLLVESYVQLVVQLGPCLLRFPRLALVTPFIHHSFPPNPPKTQLSSVIPLPASTWSTSQPCDQLKLPGSFVDGLLQVFVFSTICETPVSRNPLLVQSKSSQ